jgi:hypothetical protein
MRGRTGMTRALGECGGEVGEVEWVGCRVGVER